jgi:hypothetical protein
MRRHFPRLRSHPRSITLKSAILLGNILILDQANTDTLETSLDHSSKNTSFDHTVEMYARFIFVVASLLVPILAAPLPIGEVFHSQYSVKENPKLTCEDRTESERSC